MSWTIEPPEDEGVRRELEEAISAADKANILMFCSAADQGAKQTDTYPSRATRRIFTIGAAGPSGETNSWVGNPEKVNFTFPGDRVEIMDSTPNDTTPEISGSSAATALAAGFCALVLYCVQVRMLTFSRIRFSVRGGRHNVGLAVGTRQPISPGCWSGV